jgi:hypothetical protein
MPFYYVNVNKITLFIKDLNKFVNVIHIHKISNNKWAHNSVLDHIFCMGVSVGLIGEKIGYIYTR